MKSMTLTLETEMRMDQYHYGKHKSNPSKIMQKLAL